MLIHDQSYMLNLKEFEKTDSTEWEIYSAEEKLAPNTRKLSDPLEYKVFMRRNQMFYKNAFAIPLYSALTLILISFWINGILRTGITLLGTLILTISFIIMTEHCPLSYVPVLSEFCVIFAIFPLINFVIHFFTVKYYITGFYLSWLSFVLVLINSWLTRHPPNSLPPSLLIDIIDNRFFRYAIGLGYSNVCRIILTHCLCLI